MTAARRRLIVTELCEHFSVSQRRASRALGLPRSCLRYAPVARDERATLARRIEELAGRHPRYGYRRIWALLKREGWSVNKKAVRRIWHVSGLKLAGPRPSFAGRTGRTRTRVTSGRRAGKMMSGHGTLSSIVPATAGASSG